MSSGQVAFAEVLRFVVSLGVDPTTVLTAGTPSWCELPDDHPDKLSAVLAAGIHHALRMDCGQAALADASREISSAAAWPDIGRSIAQGRGAAYIPRKAS